METLTVWAQSTNIQQGTHLQIQANWDYQTELA